MSLYPAREQNEWSKFVADAEGNVSLRTYSAVIPKRIIWDTDVSFNKGTYTNTELFGSGSSSVVRLGLNADNSDNIGFLTAGDYTYDPAKIEVTGGTARLKTTQFQAAYAQWHMNEISGAVVSDSSGNARNGTTYQAPAWTAGILNNCLYFTKSPIRFATFGNIAAFERTQSFTIECWFNTSNTAIQNGLFGKGTAAVESWRGYMCYTHSGKIYFSLISTSGTNNIMVGTTVNFSTLAWHHLVVSYNGSSLASGVKIYLDGILQAVSITGDSLTSTIVNAEPFRLGSASGYIFEGLMDETVIYTEVLSQAKITERYNSGVGTESINVYPTGSQEITYNTAIAPTNIVGWSTVTETVTKPTNTNIKYKYAVDDVPTWNSSWLTSSELQTAIQAISNPNKLRVKFQLSTTDYTATPIIDNLNITSAAGYKTSGTYESNTFDSTEATLNWENVYLQRTLNSGTCVFKTRASNNINNMGSYGSSLIDGDDAGCVGRYFQWKCDLTGNISETPILDSVKIQYVLSNITNVDA